MKMKEWKVKVNYLMGEKHITVHIHAVNRKKAEQYALQRVARKYGQAFMYVESIEQIK